MGREDGNAFRSSVELAAVNEVCSGCEDGIAQVMLVLWSEEFNNVSEALTFDVMIC